MRKLVLRERALTDAIYSDHSAAINSSLDGYAYEILGSGGYFLVSEDTLDPESPNNWILNRIECSGSIFKPFQDLGIVEHFGVAERQQHPPESERPSYFWTHRPEISLSIDQFSEVEFKLLEVKVEHIEEFLEREIKFFLEEKRAYESCPEEFDGPVLDEHHPTVESVVEDFAFCDIRQIISDADDLNRGLDYKIHVTYQFDAQRFQWWVNTYDDLGDKSELTYEFCIPMDIAALQALYEQLQNDSYESFRFSAYCRTYSILKAPFDYAAFQNAPKYLISELQPDDAMKLASLSFMKR